MDNTLLGRCVQAWADEHATLTITADQRRLLGRGTRAILEHLAAELNHAGHHDAAGWLLGQLTAEVIQLRPTAQEPA